VPELPKDALIVNGVLVRCQAIEHELLNPMVFNYLFDLVIVSVDFRLE
jgi:hypothetical protein